jgi:2-iminobutanoate/2-iminopropanoate deaminase
MPSHKHVNLPNRRPNLPYNDAVVVGDTVYLSGRIGLDPATRKPPADPDQEARIMLDSLRDVLALEGLTMDDLVQVQIFCSDVSLFDRFNAIYRTYFTGSLPARAFLGSGPLLFGARFEIIGIARKT